NLETEDGFLVYNSAAIRNILIDKGKDLRELLEMTLTDIEKRSDIPDKKKYSQRINNFLKKLSEKRWTEENIKVFLEESLELQVMLIKEKLDGFFGIFLGYPIEDIKNFYALMSSGEKQEGWIRSLVYFQEAGLLGIVKDPPKLLTWDIDKLLQVVSEWEAGELVFDAAIDKTSKTAREKIISELLKDKGSYSLIQKLVAKQCHLKYLSSKKRLEMLYFRGISKKELVDSALKETDLLLKESLLEDALFMSLAGSREMIAERDAKLYIATLLMLKEKMGLSEETKFPLFTLATRIEKLSDTCTKDGDLKKDRKGKIIPKYLSYLIKPEFYNPVEDQTSKFNEQYFLNRINIQTAA
ncbi:hypothetical protein ACFLQ1_01405, partial [Candidatus Auribacterota bacterium]